MIQVNIRPSAHTKLASMYINSSLNIELTTDIDNAIWYKLLVNLAINSVTALTRSTASVLEVPGIKNSMNNYS